MPATEQKYDCSHCYKRYCTNYGLKKHLRTIHNVTDSPNKKSKELQIRIPRIALNDRTNTANQTIVLDNSSQHSPEMGPSQAGPLLPRTSTPYPKMVAPSLNSTDSILRNLSIDSHQWKELTDEAQDFLGHCSLAIDDQPTTSKKFDPPMHRRVQILRDETGGCQPTPHPLIIDETLPFFISHRDPKLNPIPEEPASFDRGFNQAFASVFGESLEEMETSTSGPQRCDACTQAPSPTMEWGSSPQTPEVYGALRCSPQEDEVIKAIQMKAPFEHPTRVTPVAGKLLFDQLRYQGALAADIKHEFYASLLGKCLTDGYGGTAVATCLTLFHKKHQEAYLFEAVHDTALYLAASYGKQFSFEFENREIFEAFLPMAIKKLGIEIDEADYDQFRLIYNMKYNSSA